MRAIDWFIGVGAVAFLGALASQSATGGLLALAYVAGPVALAAIGWALYTVLTHGSDIVDRLAPWLWRTAAVGFWSVFAAGLGAAVLLVVGWQTVGGVFPFWCFMLAGGALLQALAPRV
ncbi:MAG: hypothetical protein ACRC67_16835 [Inquilinus sp.]|uniref:hypothetical protein n=1 Tax=Inquilinus sp. TaxID=1932117 RepID=UPI003F3ED8ED